MPPPRRRLPRAERARRAGEVAVHDGVAHRRDLRAVGVTRADVRTEVAAGRRLTPGRQTVVVGNVPPSGRALLWQAVRETGAAARAGHRAAAPAGRANGIPRVGPRWNAAVPTTV